MTDKPRFEEIDVERINIIEPDGTLRTAIAGKARTPDPLLEGTPHDRTGTRPGGLLFFNDEGTECGGLSFDGKDGDAFAGLTLDRYQTDQVVVLAYYEHQGRWGSVLNFLDRSATPLSEVLDLIDDEAAMIERLGPVALRTSIGFSPEDGSVVGLMDSKGRLRLKLSVGPDDEPRMQFLDADGNVTFSLPPGS